MAQSAPAGARNRRITLQRSITTQNALGEAVDSWADIARVWAQRQDASGAERVRADAEQGTVTKFFTILWARKWRDLSPADRLVYDGAVYNIRAISEIGLHNQLAIEAFAAADQAPVIQSPQV
jgi:SPP1 family predicted phage head-tail adaptor